MTIMSYLSWIEHPEYVLLFIRRVSFNISEVIPEMPKTRQLSKYIIMPLAGMHAVFAKVRSEANVATNGEW